MAPKRRAKAKAGPRRVAQRSTDSDEEFDRMIALLEEFKVTGAHYDEALREQFPLFTGHAPPGHPYPEAFTEGA